MNKEHPNWGGKRPRAGRPYLNGSRPGEGERALKLTITLPRETAAFLRTLGGGNLSAGVRKVTEFYKENHSC